MRKIFSFLLLTTLLLIGGKAWGATADVTYDFTGTDWSASNGTLTNGTVSFTGEGNANFKMNDGYFFLGKSGAYITFPTFANAVEKIVVTGRSGASGSTKQNIFVGNTAVSTETTGVTGSNTYNINSNYQAAGTIYTLKVTSNHNSQITKIEVFFVAEVPANTCATPTFSLEEGMYYSNQNVEISTETEGATIYYTTDGNDPTTSSTEYTGAIAVNATTTIKAIAVKEGMNNSAVASAEYTFTTPKANIAALVSAGETGFVTLSDALVTYKSGTTAYLEDASGAIMLYQCASSVSAGDKISGVMNVKNYTVYNGLPEIKDFELITGYTKTAGNTVTPLEVTIATLESDYASYISRYVKIVGATVTSAFSSKNCTIKQSENNTIILRDQNSSATLTSTKDAVVTVTGHVAIYNTTHQIAVYEQSQIVESIEKTDPTITFNNGSVRVGSTLDLSTLFESNSTGAVTYSITAGDSYATLNGSTLTATAEGSVTVKAAQAESNAHNAGEATATITVNPALVLSSIAVTTAPTKTTYNEGETFDPAGMVITATYTDNSEEEVTEYTYSPDGALTTSDTEITISYTSNNITKTTTQAIIVNEVLDYVTLPFNWAGGASATLSAIDGVTVNADGSDYSADNHNPYLIKFNGNGKYVKIKTDVQPGVVTMGVKMIGGNKTSKIIVKQSADDNTYSNLEELEISGSTNDIINLETSQPFAATTRYILLEFVKGSNVGVGPISVALPSTEESIVVESATINAETAETEGSLAITYANMTISSADDFDIQFYDANDNELSGQDEPDWVIVAVEAATAPAEGYIVSYAINANNGAAREAYFKVFAMGAQELVYSQLVTISQAAYVDPSQYTTYHLVTDAANIVSGAHYLIASGTDGEIATMGAIKSTNYDVDDVTANNGVINIASNVTVHEFVVYKDGDYFIIYDETGAGYLYAAGGTNSNHLKKYTTVDNKGQWSISIDGTSHAAAIVANMTGRNTMRYNSGSTIFSCYASGQQDIYLYSKDNDTHAATTASVTLNGAGFATFASSNALSFLDAENAAFSAWKATGENNGKVTFEQITEHVAAGTGIFLKGEANAVINLNILPAGGAAPIGNKLVGCTTATQVSNNAAYYVLSGNQFMSLAEWTGEIPAGKAYLDLSGASAPSALRIEFTENNTTDVKAIEASEKAVKFFENGNLYILRDGVVYDATGRVVR